MCSIHPPVSGGIEWPKFAGDVFARGKATDVTILVKIGESPRTCYLLANPPTSSPINLHEATAPPRPATTAVKYTGSSKH